MMMHPVNLHGGCLGVTQRQALPIHSWQRLSLETSRHFESLTSGLSLLAPKMAGFGCGCLLCVFYRVNGVRGA